MMITDIKGDTICVKCSFYENGRSVCDKEIKTYLEGKNLLIYFCSCKIKCSAVGPTGGF